MNGAYYPNWAVYGQGPPSDLNVGCLSHVFYAFAKVEPDGTVAVSSILHEFTRTTPSYYHMAAS